MNIKIEIVNDKFCKISPFAFGTVFTNINELTADGTAEKTFANIGIYKGKTIHDCEQIEYKIVDLSQTDNTYKVSLRRIKID